MKDVIVEMFVLFALTLSFSAYEPYSWGELHATAQKDPVRFVQLVNDYYHNFPCDDCRSHFQHMTDVMQTFLPLERISTVHEAQLWAWLAHNSVNLRLQKDWFSYDRVRIKKRRTRSRFHSP